MDDILEMAGSAPRIRGKNKKANANMPGLRKYVFPIVNLETGSVFGVSMVPISQE